MPASSNESAENAPEQVDPGPVQDAQAGPEAGRSFLTRILETLPYPVSYIDADLVYRQCNSAAAATVGRTPDQVVGESVASVVGAESDVLDLLRGVLSTGQPYTGMVEFAAPGSSGRAVYRVSYRPDIDAEGNVIGVLTNVVDVTDLVRSEQALRTSEDRLRRIARAGRIGFVEYNMATDEAYWSPEHYELFGFEDGSQVDWRRWLEGVHPEDRERVEANAARMLERAAAEGQVRGHTDEYRFVRPDGTLAWIEADMSVDMVEGQPIARGAVRDITQRKRLEDELARQQEELRHLVRHAATGIYEIDFRGPRFLSVNDFMCAYSGYSREELLAMDPMDLLTEESQERFRERISATLAGEPVDPQVEYRILTKQGDVRYAVLNLTPTFEDGRPVGAFVVGQDVTERKRVEEALRESEQRFRLALRAGDVIVAICDRALRYVWIHDPHPDFDASTVIGQRDTELADNDGTRHLEALKQQVIDTGVGARGRVTFPLTAGSRVYDIQAEPQMDDSGSVTTVTTIAVDETRSERADALARERLAEIEDIYRNAPVGLCVLDRDLRFLRINERLAEINGIPAADHIGKTVRELLPGLAAEVEPGMRRILETGEARHDIEIVSETLAQPGVERSWLEQWLPTRDAEGHVIGLSIVVEEITERKQAEEALSESEESFRSLLRSSRDVLLRIDIRTGRYDYISPAVESMTGFAPDELMQMGREASLVLVHPDDLPRLADAVRATLEDGLGAAEYRQRTKSGEYRWLSNSMVLVRDEDGEPLYRIGNIRDVTDERAAAADLLEHEAERVAQQERGRLARDLHDSVTQALFAATLKAEALALAAGDQAPGILRVAEELRRLNRGALAQMRTMLLELRGEPVHEMPLHQLLRNLVEAAESRASVRIELTLDEDSTLPSNVHEAVYRITQEALNNVTRHSKAEKAWVELDSRASHARLVIGDDGCGFDPDSVEPGHFGLKSIGERADDSGGRLTLSSVQGEGTTLTVEWRFEESTRERAAG